MQLQPEGAVESSSSQSNTYNEQQTQLKVIRISQYLISSAEDTSGIFIFCISAILCTTTCLFMQISTVQCKQLNRIVMGSANNL